MPDVDEAQIVNYLLGELPDEERTRLEERFLRDVEYRELIRAVEDDLIDDYVRGDLAPHQRERFEKQFTTVPLRAHKVELARALRRALGEGPHVAKGEFGATPSALAGVRAPISAFRYSLAAAAVLILGVGVWLIIEERRWRPEVQQPQAEQRPPQPAEKLPTGPSELPAPPPPPQLAIATFVLPPGLVRDSAAARTFVIPENTQLVRLRLPLEKGDEYPAYRAELRTASGNSVWKADSVRTLADASGLSVVLDMSADLLPPDRYELTLTGINKEVIEDIGHYYFSFVKK